MGTPLSQATKDKISQTQKGKKLSPEHRLKVIQTLRNGAGDKNPAWKGGRTYTSCGYVWIKKPDHPHANKSGYVSEHRLVMESALGRYLMDKENVHHKNGVRHDNRIQNLELWTISQPSGTRVQDKISWSIEFLSKYGYEIVKVTDTI